MTEQETAFITVTLDDGYEYVVQVPKHINNRFAAGEEQIGKMGFAIGPDGKPYRLEDVATGDKAEYNHEWDYLATWVPELPQRYRIVRFFRDERPAERLEGLTGLTLEEAQAHCQRENTHELDADGVAVWFDGYEKDT